MLAAIDLHGCARRRLEDPSSICTFVSSVIEAIGMRAHGPIRLSIKNARVAGASSTTSTERLSAAGGLSTTREGRSAQGLPLAAPQTGRGPVMLAIESLSKNRSWP